MTPYEIALGMIAIVLAALALYVFEDAGKKVLLSIGSVVVIYVSVSFCYLIVWAVHFTMTRWFGLIW